MMTPLPDFSNGIKRGDRAVVDTGLPGIEEVWARVTLVIGSECWVVFDHSVQKLEHRYSVRQVRKLSLLEILADPIEDPPEEWYMGYDHKRG